jgi:hypothetical protein
VQKGDGAPYLVAGAYEQSEVALALFEQAIERARALLLVRDGSEQSAGGGLGLVPGSQL